jgi:hypothetical protein
MSKKLQYELVENHTDRVTRYVPRTIGIDVLHQTSFFPICGLTTLDRQNLFFYCERNC